jgi:hypothetical protein
MKNILYLLFFLQNIALAQKYDAQWLFGCCGPSGHTSNPSFGNSILNFNTTPTTTYYTPNHDVKLFLTYASICNPTTGDLVAYTNGLSVYGDNGQEMINGDSINAQDPQWASSAALGYEAYGGATILPKPNNPNIYYLLHKQYFRCTPPDLLGFAPTGFDSFLLLLTTINTHGTPRVISKNQHFFANDTIANFSVVKHGNGRDYWIAAQDFRMRKVRYFLLDPHGLNFHHEQTLSPISTWPLGVGWHGIASPDGSKMAFYDFGAGSLLYDFDRCSGMLSNGLRIPLADSTIILGTLAFSPNSRYLYVTSGQGREIHQYDTQAANVLTSKQVVAVNDGFSYKPYVNNNYTIFHNFTSIYLAPDNKIYGTKTSTDYFSTVIENPDAAGAACNIQQHSLRLPTYNRGTIPTYINYRLGALSGSVCDSLAVPTTNIEQSSNLRIYPNPSNGITRLAWDTPIIKSFPITIYDNLGRVVATYSTSPNITYIDIDTENWTNGLYFVKIQNETQNTTQTLSVTH